MRSLVGAEPIDWPAVIKAQTRIVMLEPQKAIEAIPALIPRQEQRELAVVIAAKALMLEPELGNPDSKAARRVQELLGVDYAAAARKLGVADAPARERRMSPAASVADSAIIDNEARNMKTKHERYQRLIDRCKKLPPTPTAVAHPCDQSSLQGAVDAAKLGLIAPILVGPRARIEAVATQFRINIAKLDDRGRGAQPGFGREGRAAGARRQGRGPDERQPAHRRADGCGGQARYRIAHRAPHQPLFRPGRARPRGRRSSSPTRRSTSRPR